MRRRVDAPERRRLRDKTGGGLGLLAPLENLPKSAAVGEYAGRRLGDVRDVGQARGGEVHDGLGELLEGGGGEARVQDLAHRLGRRLGLHLGADLLCRPWISGRFTRRTGYTL